jgi:hypothetical protein
MAIANITGNILTDSGVSTSSLVSGSGTTNYVSKFTGASTLGNSLIFDNGTNVGIGTTTLGGRLDVQAGGTSAFTYYFRNSAGGYGGGVYNTGGNNTQLYLATSAGTENVLLSPSGASYFLGGSLAVGTSNPTGRLMLYSTGNVFQNIVSPSGGSTQVGINLSPSMSDGELASNPAQASIYATDSNFGANIIFANKATGAVGNALTERMRITSGGVIAIATTGKTWESSYRALELGNGFALMAHATNSDGYITSNTYYDGSWRISSQNNVRPSIFRVYDGLQLETGNSTASVGTAVATTVVFKVNISGNVTNLNNSYGQISDVSLKKDITPSTPKLDDLMKVNIVNFKFINDETEQKQIGVIAQELEEIFPSMIDIDADGLKSVKYSVFVPMLIKAIQELNDKVSALENKS